MKKGKPYFRKKEGYTRDKVSTDKRPFKKESTSSSKASNIPKLDPIISEEKKLEKGFTQVYIGESKNRSSVVVGLAIRGAGANLKIGFFQFFKKPFLSEIKILRSINNLHFYTFASRYYESEYITLDETKKLQSDFKRIWSKTLDIIEKNNYDLVILDEILVAVQNNLITEQLLLDFILNKSESTELILTGTHLSEKINNVSDVITEVKKIKSTFSKGKSRKGIDF